jgi:hypothetical protein
VGDVVDLKPKDSPADAPPVLKCYGAGRDAENEQVLCFHFNRKPTDDEMQFLHAVMQRAAACVGI